MKPSQLDKLYDKLSPTELGMMAFDAIARKDESEADTILKNVGWNTYRSINADYRQQVEGLILLSHVYSIEHWKTRALMLQACAMLGKAVSKG